MTTTKYNINRAESLINQLKRAFLKKSCEDRKLEQDKLWGLIEADCEQYKSMKKLRMPGAANELFKLDQRITSQAVRYANMNINP
jgi:hypothetical protein